MTQRQAGNIKKYRTKQEKIGQGGKGLMGKQGIMQRRSGRQNKKAAKLKRKRTSGEE